MKAKNKVEMKYEKIKLLKKEKSIALIFALLIFSCKTIGNYKEKSILNDSKIQKIISSRYNFDKDDDSLTILKKRKNAFKSIYNYNIDGNCVESIFLKKDSSLSFSVKNFYSKSGLLLKKTCTNGDLLNCYTTEYFYNKNRQIFYERRITSNDSSETKYYYDENGNMKTEIYIKKNRLKSTKFFVYNSIGKKIQMKHYDDKNQLKYHKYFNADSKNLVDKIFTFSNNKLRSIINYEYDRYGNKIRKLKQLIVDKDTITSFDEITFYEFDSDQKIKKSTTYDMNKPTYYVNEYSYIYY